MHNHTITRALGATVVALTLGLGTAACGSDDDAPGSVTEPSATEHNDADVAFASEMLQHHAQALSMVDLTVDRPLNPEVADLAEQIRAAQGPEIETFTDWLTEWDEEVPETMRDHANAGHDMGDIGESMEGMDTSMPGMMSAEDMTALENAPDGEFQTVAENDDRAPHRGRRDGRSPHQGRAVQARHRPGKGHRRRPERRAGDHGRPARELLTPPGRSGARPC